MADNMGVMLTLLRRSAAILILLPILTTAGLAEPLRYRLDPEQTLLSFVWSFGPDEVTGVLPSGAADIVIDFQNQRNSRVTAELDLRGARAGFPFATQAMLGPRVLDAEAHPVARFESTRVRQSGTSAEIEGNLTLRGVTQPVVWQAELFRQAGAEVGDLSQIAIRMTGTVDRHAFGASGWPDDVGPEVTFVVEAYLEQVQ